ncbi:AI-2E family transporter [Desulfobulbus alkaliphilus]|uniref:AI-2E family transporter n=1 Tax=Desulfobulbus alkaliphilus TaxID=869814 RepID=UPI0019661F34|nr:AI-2E family transporter [Desulfobulbus alkaliphilus]MBM9537057.1 AI-2E family transporter [Desulfobulbus alkaliphilus]
MHPADSIAPKQRQNSEHITRTRFLALVFVFSALMLGLVLWPFWQFLVLAFLLAGIFRPVYTWLGRWLYPWVASLLTCLMIVLIVFVPFVFFIAALSSEAAGLYQLVRDSNALFKLQQALPNNPLIVQGQAFLAGFGISFEPANVMLLVSDLSRTAGLFIYNQVSAWATNLVSFVFQFCLLIIVIFFLLKEIDLLIDFLTRISPLPEVENRLLVRKFVELAGVILVGNGLSGLFQGTVGGIFFALLGFKAPVLWGAVMGILAFLPIFGIGLVLLPTAIILLVNGSVGAAVGTLVLYGLLTLLVEYLAKPKFIGDRAQMHTLLVLLAILGGMSLFGILGIIYGPLIVTAFLSLAEMYLREREQEDGQFERLADGDHAASRDSVVPEEQEEPAQA